MRDRLIYVHRFFLPIITALKIPNIDAISKKSPSRMRITSSKTDCIIVLLEMNMFGRSCEPVIRIDPPSHPIWRTASTTLQFWRCVTVQALLPSPSSLRNDLSKFSDESRTQACQYLLFQRELIPHKVDDRPAFSRLDPEAQLGSQFPLVPAQNSQAPRLRRIPHFLVIQSRHAPIPANHKVVRIEQLQPCAHPCPNRRHGCQR